LEGPGVLDHPVRSDNASLRFQLVISSVLIVATALYIWLARPF
jgi:hypothetical protein